MHCPLCHHVHAHTHRRAHAPNHAAGHSPTLPLAGPVPQVYSVRSMPTEAVLTAPGAQEWTPQLCGLGEDDDVGFDVLTAYIYVMTK